MARAVVVRRASDRAVLPFERAPVPRGMGFLTPVELAPGEQVDLVLEVHQGEAPNGAPTEDDCHTIETPFVRIDLDTERGIARWWDVRAPA